MGYLCWLQVTCMPVEQLCPPQISVLRIISFMNSDDSHIPLVTHDFPSQYTFSLSFPVSYLSVVVEVTPFFLDLWKFNSRKNKANVFRYCWEYLSNPKRFYAGQRIFRILRKHCRLRPTISYPDLLKQEREWDKEACFHVWVCFSSYLRLAMHSTSLSSWQDEMQRA